LIVHIILIIAIMHIMLILFCMFEVLPESEDPDSSKEEIAPQDTASDSHVLALLKRQPICVGER
jgi:hypothetical protein